MFIPHSSFNVLYSTDILKSAEFYKTIGCEIKQQENDKLVVQLESFQLHYILDSTEPFDSYKYITVNKNYGQGIIFYIGTHHINDIFLKVKNSNGSIKTDIFENQWNAKEFLFEDPNGYKFAVYEEQ